MHTHFLEILEMSFDSKRQIITIGVESKFKKHQKTCFAFIESNREVHIFI